MGLNLKRVEFEGDATWLCPPGVTKVRLLGAGSQGRQISGGTSMAAIDAAGAMWTWGNGFVGQLGNGSMGGAASSPVAVVGGKTWRTVSAKDGGQILAIDNAGALYAWGGQLSGEIGDGTVINRSTPVAVLGGLKWRQVSAASNYSLGITNTADLYAWGRNFAGILGLNSTATAAYSSPIMVSTGLKWRRVSGALTHWLGIDNAGNAYACGVNTDGNLGDGTIVNKSSPVLVLGGYKWKTVAAATGVKSGSAGITDAGDLFVWGAGQLGQSGNSDRVTRSSPVMIVSTKKWSQLVHMGDALYALTTEGDLYAWGSNINGLLGIGSALNVSTPTAVVGGLRWRELSDGNQSFLQPAGITVDGNIFAFGFNGQGSVGDGTIVDKSSPVLVIGAKSWRAVSPLIENELILNVVPGQSYAVVLNADYSSFGPVQLTPASSVYGVHKITLEYFG